MSLFWSQVRSNWEFTITYYSSFNFKFQISTRSRQKASTKNFGKQLLQSRSGSLILVMDKSWMWEHRVETSIRSKQQFLRRLGAAKWEKKSKLCFRSVSLLASLWHSLDEEPPAASVSSSLMWLQSLESPADMTPLIAKDRKGKVPGTCRTSQALQMLSLFSTFINDKVCHFPPF